MASVLQGEEDLVMCKPVIPGPGSERGERIVKLIQRALWGMRMWCDNCQMQGEFLHATCGRCGRSMRQFDEPHEEKKP